MKRTPSILILFLVLTVMSACCGRAWAQEALPETTIESAPAEITEPTSDEWTNEDTAKFLIQPLIHPLAILVEGLVGCLILVITLLIHRYLGVRVSEKQMGMIQSLADDAVNYAEEWANKAVKVDGKEAPSSVEKGQRAVEYASAMVSQMKLPQMLTEHLEKIIMARLGKARG